MDQAYIPRLSALAGTVVGGLTSFATLDYSGPQTRTAQLTAGRNRRSELYGKILEETAKLYSQAVTKEKMTTQ